MVRDRRPPFSDRPGRGILTGASDPANEAQGNLLNIGKGECMRGTAYWFAAVFILALYTSGYAGNEPQSAGPPELMPGTTGQVIVQIGGRYCEYYREEVERALRRFPAVQAVEFLNDHGTVLVRYQSEGIPPAQLAESVEQALASGIGCRAWVDRGGLQQARS